MGQEPCAKHSLEADVYHATSTEWGYQDTGQAFNYGGQFPTPTPKSLCSTLLNNGRTLGGKKANQDFLFLEMLTK